MQFVINDGVLEKYTGTESDVIIPEGVTTIGKNAFKNNSALRSVTIPEGVKVIEDSAFWACGGLSCVKLPLSLERVYRYAFDLCRITEIHYPDLNAWLEIGGLTKGIRNAVDLYIGDQLISDLLLPDGLTDIKEKTFFGCKSITSVKIPDSVASIGPEAFSNCHGLVCANIPDSVASIGPEAFSNCHGLVCANIPKKVTVLTNSVFFACKSLSEISISGPITKIERYAFGGCEKLKEFVIPDGVVSLGEGAFAGCSNLESITIPKSLSSIYGNTFNDCNMLKTVYFNKSVEAWISMDKEGWWGPPFRNDTTLICNGSPVKDVAIPESITIIGNGAFNEYAGLMSVSIPESVKRIGACAFSGTGISDIIIPASVTDIGPGAFSSQNLKTLTFKKFMPNFSSDWLRGPYDKKAVKVVFPEGAFVTNEKLSTEYCKADICLSDREIAYLLLYQKGKTWQTWLRSKVSGNACTVFDQLLSRYGEDKKAPASVLSEFLADHLQALSAEQIKSAISLLDERKYKGTSELKKLPKVKSALSGKTIKENPIEEKVREYSTKSPILPEAMQAVKKGIPYAGSKQISSPEAVAFILSEYVKEWNRCLGSVLFPKYGTSAEGINDGTKIELHPEADEVAKALDQEELSGFFSYLSSGIHYRPWLLAWARYADDETVDRWTSDYKTKIKGKANEFYKTYSMRECLLINDTRAAMRFFDRIGDLDRYAKIRGKTAMEIRDSIMLPDFGLNENGNKTFDTGDGIIEVSITPDLGLKLYDIKAQKELRNFPKKGENQKKLKDATDQFDEFKSSVLSFIKARTELIHKMHISGEYLSQDLWENVYLKHPVIRYLTELLIWQDRKGKTFIVSDGALRNALGKEIVPEGDIRVAHVLDMDNEKVLEWQQYLAKTGRKQLFDQIWEPIVKWDKESIGSRYMDAVITYQDRNALKKALKQKGIEAGSADMAFDYHPRAGYNFTNEGEMKIGKCIRIKYLTDPDKKEVTFKKTAVWNSNELREINAELLELDKAVVSSRIAEDNDSALVGSTLSEFTVAQITTFLNQAIKDKATKCTAVLLDFKNRHFPEYAEVNEFSLDW